METILRLTHVLKYHCKYNAGKVFVFVLHKFSSSSSDKIMSPLSSLVKSHSDLASSPRQGYILSKILWVGLGGWPLKIKLK